MNDDQTQPVSVLFVEDYELDVERALHHLKRAGLRCEWRRVQTEQALRDALHQLTPDVILSDFSLPQFDGMQALQVAQQHAPQVPFLFLSGTIGEERAIQALHAGAVDYVLKDNLARLAPAVRRAIADAAASAERVRQEAQIARLNRVLRMLSGVNGLVLRIRDRTAVLRETCRLATSVGSYAVAVAVTRVSGSVAMQPVAWSGDEARTTQELCNFISASLARESSVLSRVVSAGTEFVCNNTAQHTETATLDALLVHAAMQSVVALPLLVDNTTVGLLVLTARDADVVSDEELDMLREVAGNLSFGLQYLQRDTKARFLSHFDALTGLAKRPLFCERVQRMISSPADERVRHAVIVFDVERLSIINDTIGRPATDLLLQHVADRLRQFVPWSDQMGHFGGGTFALVRPQGERTLEQIHAACYRQADRMFSEPFLIEGQTIPVAIRVGFALCPDDGVDATALAQNAEAALRLARETGERHVHYDPAARLQVAGQLALEHRLRVAFERQQFELHYQPKVNVLTRRIQGAEALLRWRSPESGLVSPAVFLHVLESTGLILQVGDWVVRQAASDCQRWMRAGLPPVRVAVNIAPAQLRQREFEKDFLDIVRPWSDRDWGLDIEITEGVLQHDSAAEIDKLRRLHTAGVRIAIDDFGTGYSSLSRLAALPIDTLKIDRSFVSQALGSSSGGSLVRTIITLARTFDMATVAEGVENMEQLDLLQQLGCDQSQGFLHSAAMTAEDFAHALQHGRGALLLPADTGAHASMHVHGL